MHSCRNVVMPEKKGNCAVDDLGGLGVLTPRRRARPNGVMP